MKTTPTQDAVGHAGSDIVLPDDDALFGLELHRGDDGWTATTTGPHLPGEALTGVTVQDGTTTP